MRIGIDARFIQGPNTGVTNYLVNLIKALERIDRDNDYTLFLSDPDYAGRLRQGSRFKVIVKEASALFWKNVWLPKQARKLKIDVMHFPAYTCPFVKVKNSVVTVHDLVHKVNPRWFSLRELILIGLPITIAIRKAAKIIAVSESTKRDIMKFYGVKEDKIAVTLEAADSTFRPINDQAALEDIRSKYKLGINFILYVGVLFKRRNIQRLIEAFLLMQKDKELPGYQLVIAGPGKDYFDLQGLLDRYKLRDRVSYLGYVDQQDLPLLYNAASFFVYPSLYEGFGLPVLEAMSCGKAVITSNVSSLPEITGEAGILIDPYSTEELYQAMRRLGQDNGLRERLGDLALERSRNFSWEKMARQTLEVYQQAAGNRKGD
ncbi:MAG: glycosyltransferase family 1 protein [Candidatus Omnitrophica bacterium]|nr:glycosyltransferase family 1 protein [Candidatus Omnitrophota bacterium]